MERYRSGHNGADLKDCRLIYLARAKNLDITGLP